MPTLGNFGDPLDINIRQGATWGPYECVLTNADNSPVDITDAEIRGQIRRRSDKGLIPGATLTTNITSATDGEFTIQFDANDTELLDTSPIDENAADSTYVWDMEVEFATGIVKPLAYGEVRVLREVTK